MPHELRVEILVGLALGDEDAQAEATVVLDKRVVEEFAQLTGGVGEG